MFPIRQIPTNKLPKRFCLPHLKDHLQLNQPVTCAWNLTACKKHYKNTTFFGFLYFPYLLSCRHSSESFVGTFWELDSCWRPVSGPFWARVLGPYISNRGFWWVPLEPMSGWCSLAVRIISIIFSAHSRPFLYTAKIQNLRHQVTPSQEAGTNSSTTHDVETSFFEKNNHPRSWPLWHGTFTIPTINRVMTWFCVPRTIQYMRQGCSNCTIGWSWTVQVTHILHIPGTKQY